MTGPKPWWDPDVFARRRPFLEMRARIVAAVRGYFVARGFVEVETPALQVSPGLEPHLHAFATELGEPFGGGRRRRIFLHTSPEYAMKKLLAAGMPRIFQIARAFRNENRSPVHHPEFAMLEWYRANESYDALMDDCGGLLRTVADVAGADVLRWQGRICDPREPLSRMTVAEAFRQYVGFDPLDHHDVRAFAGAARSAGIAARDDDRWDDVFFRVFLERIEPHLGVGAATILDEYPAAMAALARVKADDPRIAERFELYVAGLELANAFGELTDAAEQRRRFEADNAKRLALGHEPYPLDKELLSALDRMPPSSGIALGLDRLVMLAVGAQDIEDVLWAPAPHGPEGGGGKK